MSEIDICEIKNKNYNSLNLDNFPSSGGIFPEMEFECKYLNNNEKYMGKIDICEINKNT